MGDVREGAAFHARRAVINDCPAGRMRNDHDLESVELADFALDDPLLDAWITLGYN